MDELALNIEEIIKDLKIGIWSDYWESDSRSKESTHLLFVLSSFMERMWENEIRSTLASI